MKKFCLFWSLALLLCAVCLTAVSAADSVVYLADNGTGDGSTASTPVGTLTDAYNVLGDGGGTIVLCGTYSLSASVLVPEHTGTVTITSKYGDIDYRETNGANFYEPGSYVLRLSGPTVIDGVKFVIAASKSPWIAAHFNDLTIGSDVSMVNPSGTSVKQLRIVGGGYGNTAVADLILAKGESSTLDIRGGTFYGITAFTVNTGGLTHAGTMNIKISGSTFLTALWLGVYNYTTMAGGSVITLEDTVSIDTIYMQGSKTDMYLNGDSIINVADSVTVSAFKNYGWEEPYTDTLNITGDAVTLPDGYADYFDVITEDGVQVKPEVTTLDTVYVASSGTGDGSAADKPIGTLTDAYALLDAQKGGRIVFVGDYPISASVLLPVHTGTVKWTSVYGGVDYRTTANAAVRYTGEYAIRLQGPTEMDGITIQNSSTKGIYIVANFNPLKLGNDVSTINTASTLRVFGGPWKKTPAVSHLVLEEGMTSSLEILSGAYYNIGAFSYDAASLTHKGTMYMTLGGKATTQNMWFSVTNSTTSSGGAVVATLKDDAAITGTLYVGNNKGLALTTGDITVNIQDNASINAFKYCEAALFPAGIVRTLNISGDATALPANFEECFDVVTKDGEPYEKPVFNYDVVYVADGGTGDGTSAESPVATLSEAYALLNTDGGAVVICGKLSVTAHTDMPAHDGVVTITSVYGDVDYRTANDAQLYSSVWHILNFYGETVLKDLTINLDVSFGMAMHHNPMTVDTGVVINANYDTANGGRDENGLYIVGDEFNGTLDANASYDKDTSITVRSGTISRVIGFSRYSDARHYTGHSTITVEGTGYVRYLYAGAVADNTTATSATINIREQATVERLHTGGSSQTNYMYGEVIINIDEMDGFRHDTNPDGGKIMEFDTMCIYDNKGSITMYYDASTVPEGALYLAELAKFDHILPACERAGESHVYGEAYTNPYGGYAMLRRCSICEHIEFVGDAPAAVGENVVFVTDGGFGDGSHPTFPLGSYADAMEQLKTTGGTIVLIDTVTLAANYEYKFGTEEDCYQEPAHANAILVTSVYGGTDYRKNGAKLVWNGNMNYKASGPLTLDGLVLDAVNSTGNILAARYNKLVIGKDVQMTDAISLTVVGGYQTFSYTDYVDVYIEDEWLRFSNHAIKVDTFDLPDQDYIVMHEDYPTTGYTKQPVLRKAAADAFNTMLADMVAATDANGESLGLKYPYINSAMQSYEHKHDYITRFWARTWRAHPEWSWDQVYLYVTKSTGRPGYSEHHLGVAVDMWDHTLINPSTGEVYENANQHFDETPEAAWIEENGAKYGIILRLKSAKTSYVTGFIQEQWHYRYVGPEHAAAILATDSQLMELYVANKIGLFTKDADVTLLGGTYTKVIGGSNNVGFGIYESDINLTGKSYVTIGTGATVGDIADVDVERVIGDANGDGKASIVDIIRMLRHIADATVEIQPTADYNADNVITILDVLLTLSAILNK